MSRAAMNLAPGPSASASGSKKSTLNRTLPSRHARSTASAAWSTASDADRGSGNVEGVGGGEGGPEEEAGGGGTNAGATSSGKLSRAAAPTPLNSNAAASYARAAASSSPNTPTNLLVAPSHTWARHARCARDHVTPRKRDARPDVSAGLPSPAADGQERLLWPTSPHTAQRRERVVVVVEEAGVAAAVGASSSSSPSSAGRCGHFFRLCPSSPHSEHRLGRPASWSDTANLRPRSALSLVREAAIFARWEAGMEGEEVEGGVEVAPLSGVSGRRTAARVGVSCVEEGRGSGEQNLGRPSSHASAAAQPRLSPQPSPACFHRTAQRQGHKCVGVF